MQKIIESMLGLGYEVNIIQIKPIIEITGTPMVGLTVPEEEKKETKRAYKTKKNPNGNPPSLLTPEIVENMKKKRINWKTIAKIKKLKEEGYTSGRVSHKLGIDVEVINKYWNHE